MVADFIFFRKVVGDQVHDIWEEVHFTIGSIGDTIIDEEIYVVEMEVGR